MELVWDSVYENERWIFTKGWKRCPQIPTDPYCWTDEEWQKKKSQYDHRLPAVDDDKYGWIWIEKWQRGNWKYATSFGSLSWSQQRKKKHFVRQREWKRARIRKTEIGTSEITEQIFENQRIVMMKKWTSPYLPGDPSHYADKNGHLCTMKQVESRLPASWAWTDSNWNIQIGEHTDAEGWEYSLGFEAMTGWTKKYKKFAHNVRRRKWTKNRKLSGLMKETKKLKSVSNIKQVVIDEADIDIDEGWDDDDAKDADALSQIPPFEIGVCWEYDKIFRESKQSKNGKKQSLSVWKPKLRQSDDDSKEEIFILGYLALNRSVDPNENIPMLTVKAGTDKNALSKPANFELIHCEKTRRCNPKNKNKEIDVYRYWLRIIAKSDYFAMGSIVIEQYQRPIDESVHTSLKEYFYSHQSQQKYLKLYALDKIRCIHKKYLDKFGQPMIEKLSCSKKGNFSLHRQSSLALSGIYKLVEMPMIIRSNEINIGDDCKMEHHSHCIKPQIMDLCIKRMQINLRIVGDSPLIISYATHFRLVWSSDKITTTSNTKAAVWEPVLGKNEFFVGHIAFGDWKHPFWHQNNNKLLIIKQGGSDPDAFKEPLGFECIWSVYSPNSKQSRRQSLSKQKAIGSGLLISKVGSSVGLIDSEGPKSASFWRAICPNGYSALGHIALPIDGEVGTSMVSLLESHNVPKYVCIKDEYLTKFRKFENGQNKEQTMLNKVRNCIWNSEKCDELAVHAGIYAQEPFSRNIVSPMFCKQGLTEPCVENELYKTLILEKVIEAKPSMFVYKAGILKKRGEGFYAKSQKRYFVLHNDGKKMDYWNEIEQKGQIDLKQMLRCGICENSPNEFWIETKERKWQLEVLDGDKSTNGMEWIDAIRFVANYDGDIDDDYNDDDNNKEKEEMSEHSLLSSMSSTQSHSIAFQMEEKESSQIKIVKLLSKMLKRYSELLKNAKNENETTESVESAVAWYENLENTRKAIDILLAEWPRGTVCPPGVVRARSELKNLMTESVQIIMNDIRAYSNENMNDLTILRLHTACCFMQSLEGGRIMVSEWITESLLKNCEQTFVAGNKASTLANIDRRFNEYRRQIKEYDKKYDVFVPKWWGLANQISARFCSQMGASLDDQLTQFEEQSDAISIAKQKCIQFEQELIDNAMRRMTKIEIDIRSRCTWDKSELQSYIKIDDENVMVKGSGLCVVCLDLFTKEIIQKKIFPICKYSAHKTPKQHKQIIEEWLSFLAQIDDQTLIIMATNEQSGRCDFDRSLGIKDAVPKELSALHITLSDMADPHNLFCPKGAFIYIGRKGRKDSYFTILKKEKSKGPLLCRRVLSPFIPKNRLAQLVDTQSIPFYEGIISQVLERHLDVFVGSEAKNVSKILNEVWCNERMNKIKQKDWLQTINKMAITQKTSACLESITKIEQTMKASITACKEISKSKPLLDLLKRFGQILEEYAHTLLKLLNDAKNEKQSKKNNKKNTQQIEFFVIFCCMIYNSCNRARDLLNDLMEIDKNEIIKKYKNGAKNVLNEAKKSFFLIEDKCVNSMALMIVDFVFLIFDSSKESSLQSIKKELNDSFDSLFANCHKLLPPMTLLYFYKVFIAHFAKKLFDAIFDSNLLSGNILVDFVPIFESVLLKKIPPRKYKSMQIFMSRCFLPNLKLIEIVFGNAGTKYSKLQTSKKQRLSLKFFNSSSNKKEEIKNEQSQIVHTDFATKAVEFYTNNGISLQILKNVPIYQEIFADDLDVDNEESVEIKHEIEKKADDEDYFKNENEEKTQKSKSGFVVKRVENKQKKKEKEKKMIKVPTMSAPKIPSFGIGLSDISMKASKQIKLNQKWEVIERVMALRGFDVLDQKTVRNMIEEAQKNIEAQNY